MSYLFLIDVAVIIIKNLIIIKLNDCGNLIIYKSKKADNSNKPIPSKKAMPLYFEIGETNAPTHVKISIGEPILVNSNSFKNLDDAC